MGYGVLVPGPALIQTDATADSKNTLKTLGYTTNGADLVFDGFYVNVPGDENGGDEGPPIEVLMLGMIARVRLELDKYDTAVIDAINARYWANPVPTVGTPPTVGIMMFANDYTFRLKVTTTVRTYDFPRAFTRGPIEMPRYGSKYSMVVCEFECHKNAWGVLFTLT